MISTVTNRGLMRFMFYRETMTAQLLIRFLKRLIRSSQKKIFLILDNLRVHHSKLLQEWLTENKAFIEIFYLPSYSPDLNPDELLNRDLKAALSKTPAAKRNGRRQNGMGSLKNMQNPICEAFKNNRRRSKLFFTRSLSNTPAELQVLNCGSNINISSVININHHNTDVLSGVLRSEAPYDFPLCFIVSAINLACI